MDSLRVGRLCCRFALCAVMLCGSLGSASAQRLGALFDKPLRTLRIALPGDPLNPQAKARLSCFYYPNLLVKEIDLGEKGAESLVIQPFSSDERVPPCRRKNERAARVIDGNQWSGYFLGVKGAFVFFEGADGWNGGMSFAVFDDRGSQLYQDATLSLHAVRPAGAGSLNGQAVKGDSVRLLYRRLYRATCSLRVDEQGCWAMIRQLTGLRATHAPDCRTAYDEAARSLSPAQQASVIEAPSVIGYEVEAVLSPDTPVMRLAPRSGELSCFAAE